MVTKRETVEGTPAQRPTIRAMSTLQGIVTKNTAVPTVKPGLPVTTPDARRIDPS
jgi:hypothetical protein